MAEVVFPGSARPQSAPPTAYAEQTKPYIRNKTEKDKWDLVERDNNTMSRKLDAIRREAPNNFHSPNGYDSLRGGKQVKKLRSGMPAGKMTGTNTHKAVMTWPPRPASANELQRRTRMATVCRDNQRMHTKLVSTYRSKEQSSTEGVVGISGVDCIGRWAHRTALYADNDCGGVASPPNGVPKSLGVVSCGGCGTRSYLNAGGTEMFACKSCQQVWYCSQTCARVDYPSHKAICRHHVHGLWSPGGARSRDEYWVGSAAMAAGRKLLKQRQTLGLGDELEEQVYIVQAVAAAKHEEARSEQLQRRIERQAYDGLNGPRPCLYMGGKPVGKLDKRSSSMDRKMMPAVTAFAGARQSRHLMRCEGMDGPVPA